METTKTVFTLLVLLLATLSQCERPISIFQRAIHSPHEQCAVTHPSDFKISIISYRNKTGHWTAQMQLEHGEKEGQSVSNQHEKEEWLVDLEQTTVKCKDFKTVQIVATITAPDSNIPPGYELFPGVGLYNFHNTSKTWDEARKICQQEGGYLVIINSEEESKILQNLFSKVTKTEGAASRDYIFVGFHDRFVEGEYVTIFGKPLGSTGFTRWSSDIQPDNAGGSENCGTMHRNGGLNDYTCSKKLPFICELELL